MKLIAYYDHFNAMYFQKENILKPLYLSKLLKQTCYYYYGNNNGLSEIPLEYQGIRMVKLNTKGDGLFLLLRMFFILIKNAKRTDYLFTFHITNNAIILTYLYKKLNPSGHVWISADMDITTVKDLAKHEFVYSNGLKGTIKRKIINYFFKNISVFSVETKRCYNCFYPLFKKKGWKCLTYLPCGVDEDSIKSIEILSTHQKENIILSVGRFGSYQKNTEMLLEGIAQTDLKNWKVILVGPITKDFSFSDNNSSVEYEKQVYIKYPHLKGKVIFIGPVFDPGILNNYFNKAKIFLMTSRFEAFANVFSQALWFRCHIMSTDVGGAQDLSNNWKYGTKLKQEDPGFLSESLQKLINNENLITYPDKEFAKKISYNNLITQYILPKLNS